MWLKVKLGCLFEDSSAYFGRMGWGITYCEETAEGQSFRVFKRGGSKGAVSRVLADMSAYLMRACMEKAK
jgi:hypothetical protein